MCNVLTDTHCHLNLDKFDSDRDLVLERARQVGVERILIPGLSLQSSISVVNLTRNHPTLYAAIGVHPTEVATFNFTTIKSLHNLASEFSGDSDGSKIVAIGEVGLDYYWDSGHQHQQQEVLIEQLALAADLQIPVVIHFREQVDASDGDCASDLLRILQEWEFVLRRELSPLVGRTGVLHSFSGSLEMAQEAIELGFYIGVSGTITYPNGQWRRRLIETINLDHILIETDAPFQTPVPHRGKRNEPAYLRLIADKIAFVHATTTEKVAFATSENARRLFAWD
jgi:TatD DNase family protein